MRCLPPLSVGTLSGGAATSELVVPVSTGTPVELVPPGRATTSVGVGVSKELLHQHPHTAGTVVAAGESPAAGEYKGRVGALCAVAPPSVQGIVPYVGPTGRRGVGEVPSPASVGTLSGGVVTSELVVPVTMGTPVELVPPGRATTSAGVGVSKVLLHRHPHIVGTVVAAGESPAAGTPTHAHAPHCLQQSPCLRVSKHAHAALPLACPPHAAAPCIGVDEDTGGRCALSTSAVGKGEARQRLQHARGSGVKDAPTTEALPRVGCARRGCNRKAKFTCAGSGVKLCSKSCQHRQRRWSKGESVPALQKGTGGWCAGIHTARHRGSVRCADCHAHFCTRSCLQDPDNKGRHRSGCMARRPKRDRGKG